MNDRRAGFERRQIDKARAIAEERAKLEAETASVRGAADGITIHPDGSRSRQWGAEMLDPDWSESAAYAHAAAIAASLAANERKPY